MMYLVTYKYATDTEIRDVSDLVEASKFEEWFYEKKREYNSFVIILCQRV